MSELLQSAPARLADDPRFEAAKFVKDWSTWMVTTEGVMIAFLVNALAKDNLKMDAVMATWTVVLFSLSIIMAAWVLGSLPSITQRLHRTTCHFGEHGLFDLPVVRRVRLHWVTFLQHTFFLAGLVTLGLSLPPVRALLGWNM